MGCIESWELRWFASILPFPLRFSVIWPTPYLCHPPALFATLPLPFLLSRLRLLRVPSSRRSASALHLAQNTEKWPRKQQPRTIIAHTIRRVSRVTDEAGVSFFLAYFFWFHRHARSCSYRTFSTHLSGETAGRDDYWAAPRN